MVFINRNSSNVQAERIYQGARIVAHEPIKIRSTFFLQRVPIWPSSGTRVVVAVSVVKQIRFIVLVFGREPEGIGVGHGPGGANDFSEGAILVLGSYQSVHRVHQRRHVSVAIVSAEMS